MSNFEIPIESILNEIIFENRNLALQASTLRAGLAEIRNRIDDLSAQVNGAERATTTTTTTTLLEDES